MKLRAAFVLPIVAVPLAAAAAAGAPAGSSVVAMHVAQPRTVVSTAGPIRAFAQDNAHLAWITAAGRCGYRLHIHRPSQRRTVSIDGIACTDNPSQSDLWSGEFAIANGRALWHVLYHFSISQFGILTRTASIGDRRIRTLPCCDLYHDELEAVPEFPVAAHGNTLVYYSHRDEGAPSKERAIRSVVAARARKLFDTERPLEIAVDAGRVAVVRRGRGKHCACSFSPVWSPDGTRIAFLRADGPVYDPYQSGRFDPGRPTEIALIDADGAALRLLTNDGRRRSSLDWSPDGSKFVYAYEELRDQILTGTKIAVANVDGTDSRDIATGFEPEWSPNGSAIVFESGGAVSVVDSDGTGLRKLVRGEQPSWSPDGTKIAFSRGYLPGAVYVMRADGTEVRKVASDEARAGNPSWAPDGRAIVYDGNRGIYRVNADGTGRRRLTKDGRDFTPDWSPDGRRLVVASLRDDRQSDAEYETELYVLAAADASGLRSITGQPEWSSLGETRSSNGALLASFQATGEPRALAMAGVVLALLAQRRAGPSRIVLFDPRSGKRRGVVPVPRETHPALAASDRWVVFSVGELIKAIDVHTHAVLVLARTTGAPIGLSVSGRRVAWAENIASSKSRIRAVSLP